MLSGKRPSLALALVADTELYRYLPELNVDPQNSDLFVHTIG